MDYNKLTNNYRCGNWRKYHSIYFNINDSIQTWIKDTLAITKYISFGEWKLDSTIIINKDSNRLFTTINFRNTLFANATQDDVHNFGGAFIQGKWYFFFLNSSMVIPREKYQYGSHLPLTFEKLSRIANEEIIRKAYKAKDDSTFIANESFFKYVFYDPNYWGCKNENDSWCFDSIVIAQSKEKYKYKLTTEEIMEIRKAADDSFNSM